MESRTTTNKPITDEYSLSSSYIHIMRLIGSYETESEIEFTSLHDALNRCDVSLPKVRVLLESALDVNLKKDCELGSIYRKQKCIDVTPLHIAVHHHASVIPSLQNNALLTLLLDSRADVNAQDGEGNTPLHYATGHNGDKDFSHWGTHPTDDANKRNTMRFLLANGADPSIKNHAGIDCRHAVAPLVRSDWFLEWCEAKEENDEAMSRECDQDIGQLTNEHIDKLIADLKMLHYKNDHRMLLLTIADAKGCNIYYKTSFLDKALNVDASLVSLLGELLTTVPATEKVYDPKYKNPYLAEPSVKAVSENSTILRLA